MREIRKVLTIAGSDCSGGAGIQADIKTVTAHGMYAMSVITALTAQNTTGVSGILDVSSDFIGQQLDCVFRDIPPDSVKIGMVSSRAAIQTIAQKLAEYKARQIVIDPVLASSSGTSLLSEDAREELLQTLLPLASLVTPNLPEAQILCGFSIENEEDRRRAAEKIGREISASVLIKGGHLAGNAEDLLFHEGKITRFFAERVRTKNSHGTGCTLSSAIACGLAAGLPMEESVRNAKTYVTGALEHSLPFGSGSGPLNHMFAVPSFLSEKDKKGLDFV